MEIVRAFAGEAGALEPKVDDEAPEKVGFVLSDVTLARELKLSAQEAEAEAKTLTSEQLEEMNHALDEYILRQMCFKSEIVDEIARLHEDSAYAILGISSDATDAEIKRAYRLVARECHPDKGGDKEDFQDLTNAYEKIMEQRRSSGGIPQRGDRGGRAGADSDDGEKSAAVVARKAEEKGKSADKEGEAGEEKDKDKKGEGGEKGEKGEKGEGDEDAEEAFGEVGEGREGGSAAQLLEKASKAAEEASRYAKTAAEFAHQAADAAETARQGREQGSHETLTKSIAHSAIVLTLTVVKAVRVVGYATLDVAAQCRAAAKRNPEATECSEQSSTAMTLGLEALNAALACAEVTESTAAQLQQTPGGEAEDCLEGDSAAADRYVNAAVKASLAAASASNAAMSAAIAAVEGSRQCTQALGSNTQADGKKGDAEDKGEDDEAESADEADEKDEEAVAAEEKRRRPTPEEAAANTAKRLVEQRHNNHKVLQRLNSEILGHQQNVREFLRHNRQLIPEVSGESKQKVAGLLQAYAREASGELRAALARGCGGRPGERAFAGGNEVLAALQSLPMLVPFFQSNSVAISVSVKARILKMSALHDLPLAMRVLDQEIFAVARQALSKDDSEGLRQVSKLQAKMQADLSSNVAEEAAAEAAG